MGPLKRIRRTYLVRKILGSSPESEPVTVPPPPEAAPAEEREPAAEVPDPSAAEFAAGINTDDPLHGHGPAAEGEGIDESPEGTRGRLTGWVERRAHSVVSRIYDSRADDLETRARRAVSSAYADQADDLEDRAVRAMRRAITTEADRIKDVIEHAVQVKKREVRLSLLVLVTASLVYLALYWFTSRPAS